jgi:pyruvate,water dikinase
VLRGITGTWGVDPSGGIHNELISAQGDIESTRVSEALIDLARTISWDEELCDRILDSTPQQALDIIRRHPRTGAALEEYLRVYGDRCIAELKLESRSMRDDPRFCIAMVQNYLRQPDVLDRQTANPASRNREEALKRVRRHLGMKLTRFGAPKLPIYLWVLKNAGKAVRNRENQRLARTRAFALVRRIFRSIGRTWSSQRILEHADDVFYLELAEIRSFVSGASTLTDLRGLVALRKRQYELYREEPPYPDHVETYGDVYVGNVFGGSEPRAENGKALRGLGAFPGVVEKEAVVLFEPDMTVRLNGEILVTRQTDPGWVVLFPGISGLVVERGSMLSHSAIVAREMGIPAVVGVSGAASMIRSGDRLRLDGASGTVEILERGTE